MKSAASSQSLSETLVNHYWHPACTKSELSSDKDFVRFDVLGFEIVIFNDDGVLIAFDNRCPHRGTRFFLEDFGNRRILCPYHGWNYSAGKLRIPNKASFVGCDIENASLRKFKLEVCGELIFVSIQPRNTLIDQLGKEVFSIVEKISFDFSDRADFNRYQYSCDWTIAIENALEPYHIPLIHRDTLATLKLGIGTNEFYGENSIWYSSIGDEKLSKRLESFQKFFVTSDPYKGYMSIFLYPFSMISSTYGYSYSLQSFFPSDNDRMCHFTSRLFPVRTSNARYDEIATTFARSSADLNRRVFAEDQDICSRIPSDTWSLTKPTYTSDLEEKIIHFRRSCMAVAATPTVPSS